MATQATELGTDFQSMVTTLDTLATQAEAAKSAKADAPEVKLARASRVILSTFPELFGEGEGAVATMPPGVVKFLEGANTLSPDAFDRTEGEVIGTLFGKLLEVPEDYRPEGFNAIADSARAALDKWVATRPGRRAGSGSGESTTPESQKLATYGIGGVTITMSSDKLDAPVSITHRSTWSSLSDQINRVAKKVDDQEGAPTGTYSYQKVDPSARDAWRAAVEALKSDPTHSTTFTMTLNKGSVDVTIKGERA